MSWTVRPQEAEGDSVIVPQDLASHPTHMVPAYGNPEGQSQRVLEAISSPEERVWPRVSRRDEQQGWFRAPLTL